MELDCTLGNYCRAVAFSTVLRHYGYPLSEAMCFGLGASLDFGASKLSFGKYGERSLYCFSGNNSNDIYYISDLLDLDLQILQPRTSKQALHLIDKLVNQQEIPIIARVCIREYLPYLKCTPLNHVRESQEVFRLIDSRPTNHVTIVQKLEDKYVTIREPNIFEESVVPTKAFRKALNPHYGVVSTSANILFRIQPTLQFEHIQAKMPALTAQAILDNMDMYLHGGGQTYGVGALEKVNNLVCEGLEPDDQEANLVMFRFFCDTVSGGGFYRRLYSRFLKEANTQYYQDEQLAKCAKVYAQLSRTWSQLSKLFLRVASKENDRSLQMDVRAVCEQEILAAQRLYETVERIRNEL